MQTLHDILSAFKAMDDDQAPEDFDPAVVVGDLKDKVDAIKWRVDQWNAEAKAIEEEWIKPLSSKVRALRAKVEKLNAYATSEMIRNNFETLPGNAFRIDLRNSPVSVKPLVDACAELYVQHQDFMKLDTSYSWDKKAIKEAIERGDQVDFAQLVSSRHIRYFPKKGAEK